MTPIAYALFGGSGAWNKTPAGNPVTDYAAWAMDAAPKMKAQGYTRAFMHNPGGQHAIGWMPDFTNMPKSLSDSRNLAWAAGVDARLVRANQWQLAEESGCPFADRRKLKLCHELLVHHGVTEVIWYVGSPDMLRDPYRDGLAVLEVFTSLGPEASIGFDVLGDAPWMARPKHDASMKLCEELQKRGHKVYVEPRPPIASAAMAKHIDGSVAGSNLDTAGPQAVKYATADKFGERLQLSESSAVERAGEFSAGSTPVVRLWREVKAADVKVAKQ